MAFGGFRTRGGYEEIGNNPFEENWLREWEWISYECLAPIFKNKTKFVKFVLAIFSFAIFWCLVLSMVWKPSKGYSEKPEKLAGLKCYKCGEDGKCQNNATETLIECANEEMTCMLKSEIEEQFRYDVKDCYNAPEHLKMVGCLKISSDMPGGEDEHICLCDKDGCNEKMCPKERCDCAFADPNNCIHVDESAPPISCRHCEGDACLDGKNGELKECTQGESTCMYVNAKVKNNTVISRACFYEATGARLRGCVEVEEGSSFSGQVCYCDTDDCNVQTCDHRFCDCLYSDPTTCQEHHQPTGIPNSSSVLTESSVAPAT